MKDEVFMMSKNLLDQRKGIEGKEEKGKEWRHEGRKEKNKESDQRGGGKA
jgi:hypothetical protein